MSEAGAEHAVEVTSIQEYGTMIYPENTSDGLEPAKDVEFREERKITFECECGQRFRKWATAIRHLRSVGVDNQQDAEGDSE